MNSSSPVGGYLELELGSFANRFDDGVLLNSARSAFEYILQARRTQKIYISKFTCDVMLEPLARLNIPYEFYALNNALEIETPINLHDDELLVYVNYFGVKDQYAVQLAEQYGRGLVIDASQALFFDHDVNAHTIYSPRKFIGMPDGGIVYTDVTLKGGLETDVSYQRASHLLKRIDIGPQAAYADFKENDGQLSGQPLKNMSQLSRRLLQGVDLEKVRLTRQANFAVLHEKLQSSNKLQFDGVVRGPMVYPYQTDDDTLRKRLIEQNIFVATYWPNVFEWCSPDEPEYGLAQSILPLPIDQRYGIEHMNRILEVIHG